MKRLCLFIVTTLSSLPVCAGLPSYDRCRDRTPYTLNVGVPRIGRMTRDDTDRVKTQLSVVLSSIPRAAEEDCRNPRPIATNIAIGSDYEILEWMSDGTIDVAILPDTAVSLLLRDGASIYEVAGLDETSARSLVPAAFPEPFVEFVDLRIRKPDTTPLREYDAFLEQVWSSAESKIATGKEIPPRQLDRGLVLASHLSSTGFAWPVNHALAFFEAHSRPSKVARDEVFVNELWTQFFAQTRFSLDCPEPGECLAAAVARDVAAPLKDERFFRGNALMIVFPAEQALAEQEERQGAELFAPHLLINRVAASRVFAVANAPSSGVHLRQPRPHTPAGLQALFDAPDDQVPRPFRAMIAAEPAFGARTYAFRIDELMRLLSQQQKSSGEQTLALVLPGGGVKAAYQTGIVDELYTSRYLLNEFAPVTDNNLDALPVKTVIGTSGGALLGYFVSQAGSPPVRLFDVLWKPNGRPLESSAVFGGSDFPRYLSIVGSIFILTICFFFASSDTAPRERFGAFRWRLTLTVVPLFLLAPLAIKMANRVSVEHVPEIEGLLYALMTVLVVIADQVIIKTRDRDENPKASWYTGVTVVGLATVGVAFTAVPLLGDRVQRHPPFALSFFTMLLFALGAATWIITRYRRIEHPWHRALEISFSVVIVTVLCWNGWVLKGMQALAGVLLFLIGACQYLYIRLASHVPDSRRRQYGALQALLTFAAVWLIAELCWPVPRTGPGLSGLMRSPSLQMSTGAFFVSLGFVCLIVAAAVWAYRGRAYTIDAGVANLDFALATLFGYVGLTLVTIVVLNAIAPEVVTVLELRWQFWLTVLIVSGMFAQVIVVYARSRNGGRIARSIQYLYAQHENGLIGQRRYSRMFLAAAFAVFWWNIVQAPALYGNRVAREYHERAIEAFDQKRCGKGGGDCIRFSPTARFVAPANLLKQDGTYYFMFLPAKEAGCPLVQHRPASGAQWHMYRTDGKSGDGCDARPLDDDIKEVTFASGSPFPIFPAHALQLLRRTLSDDDNAFVDGGYSNNVPLDAARTLSARQVLVVHSSCPLSEVSHGSPPVAWLRSHVLGKLVSHSERLPGYLFDRSQQVDRLSSREMFVAAIAPSPQETKWPALFDFRASVVTRMEETARRDLSRRVGLVQSWGQPQFSLHADLNAPQNAGSATR